MAHNARHSDQITEFLSVHTSNPLKLLVSLVVVEIRFFGIRAWNFSFTIAL